jgi:regulator of protease activity HflC (stomatin/prohibitin superfamily)
MSDYVVAVLVFFALTIGLPIVFAILRFFGFYAIVQEKQSIVYVLFGSIVGQIDEPGLHILLFRLGWRALFVNWIGRRYVLDMKMDQEYLRSQTVNSEEGAPMGIGIWYEMYISNPVSYIFKNSDPRGSLAANVGNSTVRSLSNMPLDKMMSDRHSMSQVVRVEVSSKSSEWGYMLGSCYVRKVHFRDMEMIRQIESKVVNRLRQVTSAIKQDGMNQVSIIASTAEKEAAVDFAKAAAIRLEVVGETLREISLDPEVTEAMFEVLELTRIMKAGIPIEYIPARQEILDQLLVSH